MNQKLYMQDPSDPATIYLFESLVSAIRTASTWTGMFAFATEGGIRQLLEDEAFVEFFERGGKATLILGIDAVTNRAALEAVKEIAETHGGLFAKVFWTPLNSLFHPKVSLFTSNEGAATLVVGSGNLTPGGLSGNFEAYSVATSDDGTGLEVSAIEDFMGRHSTNLGEIDDEALERASKNIVRGRSGAAGARRGKAPEAEESEDATSDSAEFSNSQRVLIAQVPKAGNRWEQAHFNDAVIAEFFQVTDLDNQRVFLTHVSDDGSRGEETPRRVVYSDTNKNYKIEVENPSGKGYPEEGRPILVMIELGARAMEYILLFPEDTGHTEMQALNDELPSVGKGLSRVLTDVEILRRFWPDAPFFKQP